jgi:hypothetical protein
MGFCGVTFGLALVVGTLSYSCSSGSYGVGVDDTSFAPSWDIRCAVITFPLTRGRTAFHSGHCISLVPEKRRINLKKD